MRQASCWFIALLLSFTALGNNDVSDSSDAKVPEHSGIATRMYEHACSGAYSGFFIGASIGTLAGAADVYNVRRMNGAEWLSGEQIAQYIGRNALIMGSLFGVAGGVVGAVFVIPLTAYEQLMEMMKAISGE